MLPKHCGQMMVAFFGLSLIMSLVRDAVPTKWSVFIPVPMAMAIPFYIGANVPLDICVGAVIKAYWYWTSPVEAPGKVTTSSQRHACYANHSIYRWPWRALFYMGANVPFDIYVSSRRT